ncbi:peptide deformylase [Streptomyces sp. NPDC050549]|uniref:peptide deformylase n=1 Tax=Streptomyces sp. NPDC050549 TaxID=3155406 RepID=UPI0034406799
MPIKGLVQLDLVALSEMNSPLFQESPRAPSGGDQTAELVRDLIDTMHAHSICVGLAAPQIGVQQAVAVVNVSELKSEPDLVLVNPVLLSATGKKDVKFESCMSLPGWRGSVERRRKIHVAYSDLDGNELEIHAEGFLARAIQHELDHLKGIIYAQSLASGAILERTDLFERDV